MTDQLTLAVNHALNDARMARARMGLMAPTMGLDNKRHSAWCEYGFPEQVTYENLYALYRRGGLTEVQVSGRVVGVPDADRVFVFNTVTKELSCLHSPGHGLAKDVEVRRTAYAAEIWTGPGPSGETQKLPGYTTDVLEAAVHAIGHDKVLDLYAAPKP